MKYNYNIDIFQRQLVINVTKSRKSHLCVYLHEMQKQFSSKTTMYDAGRNYEKQGSTFNFKDIYLIQHNQIAFKVENLSVIEVVPESKALEDLIKYIKAIGTDKFTKGIHHIIWNFEDGGNYKAYIESEVAYLSRNINHFS